MAKPPSADSILRNIKKKQRSFEPKNPIADEMFLPNVSNVQDFARKDRPDSAFTKGSVLFVDADGRITQDNSNLFWDDANNRLGIGTTTPTHDLDVHGHMEIEHTADEDDDHALEIHTDAAGFGDVKALDIIFTTGAIATGNEEEVILINIDQTLATGGDIAGLEVLSTEGSATVHGLEVGALVAPIEQISGVFVDMDRVLVKTSNETNALKDGGAGNVTMFVADDDTVTIGDLVVYQEIEFILDIGASGAGIQPKFEFSTGVDAWTTFTPTDGTNGFENTGIIFFLGSDIPTWAVGANNEFLIRITRQRNNLTTVPRCDKVQIVKGIEFSWDKNGDLIIHGLNMSSQKITSVLDPTADQDAATKKYVDDTVLNVNTIVVLDGAVATLDGNVLILS